MGEQLLRRGRPGLGEGEKSVIQGRKVLSARTAGCNLGWFALFSKFSLTLGKVSSWALRTKVGVKWAADTHRPGMHTWVTVPRAGCW